MTRAELLRRMQDELHEGGLHGYILVRDLLTGEELGIEPDTQLPAASLVKVPLAGATAERIRRGELDGEAVLDVQPGRLTTPGPTGLSHFRHPARIAVDDLLYLSTSLSDGTAADALFTLTPPDQVSAILEELGLRGISVRHTIGELTDTPAERFDAPQTHLAHALAIDAGTSGRGHRIRSLMTHNLLRHRLAPDFDSDASTWSSKTGTLLNLRHEIGVVEHADRQTFAIAVLTESFVPAGTQPGAGALMAQVARTLRDHLRQ
ncbi:MULTISPECIES: serine hydrolase [Streptomyces]|uniref:serine hydrolase n=1 Tax=Streptomyces TaxID=1883 RepID=UPI0014881038|nr:MULTISPECIES: serine hydrolase [Streptomyces]